MSLARRTRLHSGPAKKRRKTAARPEDLVVPGYTRSVGVYKRYVMAPMIGEKKYFDIETNLFIPSGAATRSLVIPTLNAVPQGTGASERIGRNINVSDIGMNFQIWMASSAGGLLTLQSHVARMVIFLDKQCNGAVATVQDLFRDATGSGNPGALSYRNLDNSGRFNILYDQRFILNCGGVGINSLDLGVTGQRQIMGTFYKDKCNTKIEFSGATGVLAEMKSNNIGFVLLLNDVPNPGSPNVNVQFNSRIRYTDN